MGKGIKFASNRILQLRDLLSLSQTEFARKIGISQGALSQLESGRTNLSIETLKNLSDSLHINCNWMVSGQGQMFSEHSQYASLGPDQVRPIAGKVWIPLVREEAHAGYVKNIDDEDFISALDVYQIPGFESGTFRLFEIEGDSMIPTIYPREIVVCEPVEEIDTIQSGTLGVVITKESIVAKRIYQLDKEPHALILRSDNTNYKTFKVDRSHINQVWQIVAKITSQFIDMKGIDNKRLERLESHIEDLRNEMRSLKKGEQPPSTLDTDSEDTAI